MNSQIKTYKDALYNGGRDLIIVGLTGFTGSGCSTAKKILSGEQKIPIPRNNAPISDETRERTTSMDVYVYEKIKAIWKQTEWEKFTPIEVSKIIFMIALSCSNIVEKQSKEFEILSKFIDENNIKSTLTYSDIITSHTLEKKAMEFIKFYEESLSIYKRFKDFVKKNTDQNFTEILQVFGDEIRRYGRVSPNKKDMIDPINVFLIPKKIAEIINIYKLFTKKKYFVIDSLKNPFEIDFLKHQFSDFYLIGMLRKLEDRIEFLTRTIHRDEFKKIQARENGEKYKKNKEDIQNKLTSQDIKECFKKVDMFVSNSIYAPRIFFQIKFNLIKLLTLIKKPGCVTPTQDERCMQLAMSLRLVSGCISRKVGAIVIDKDRKVVGAGWNDPPKGQIPCLFRTGDELLNNPPEGKFSDYEMSEEFIEHIENSKTGKNSFCFRTEYEEVIKQGNGKKKAQSSKQAEFTRALHAEENALFQATGNVGKKLDGFTLYTTARTCTLCAKKSYQLGIERIVYIDEYKDIAIEQTLKSGNRKDKILIDQFSGIIGNAYFKLYSPVIPEKTELKLLLD